MVAAGCFALMVALIKLLGQSLSVTQILFVRQAGMTVMLLPVLLKGSFALFKTAHIKLHILRTLLALVAMLSGFTAVVNLPLADATAIGFAKSFFVTIFAVLVLKESVGVYRWSAVFVGFLGVMIMVRPGAEGFSIYNLYAIISAACAGMVMVIIRKLTRQDATNTILVYQAVGVGVIIAIPAFLHWVPPTGTQWLILAMIGVVSFCAQKANILAYTYGEASLLASLDYIRLLYATLLGWLFFNELPGKSTWIGAAVIVLASMYTFHRERQKKRRLASDPESRQHSQH